MKKSVSSLVLAMFLLSGTAWSSTIAYMSGSSEPWGSNSNISAMNIAFGSGKWNRISFSDSFSKYSTLYIDGGGNTSTDFGAFVRANRSALENYVLAGGRLFLNAAVWGDGTSLVFGASIGNEGEPYSSRGYAEDITNPIFNGAGASWGGDNFSHSEVQAAGFTTFITGQSGNAILSGARKGKGYVLIGTQTNTDFHYSLNDSDPFQLRVNELRYVAQVNTIPEPETYALMGFGLVALTLRMRRRKTTPR
ncbi:PEP-CTERM sorting domain-containing protein [Paludibacterium paludis]|uniref:Ice-binding protein C-terminal domain-containing protein n=1 Tax=Paludibacterium paludis TaxID=1225769 RepID=A0A918P2P4_9NEIS|nr:PEP-CTERM sorting domain-containing protein [Paludibacterium paludis]GGY16495.1 hypothetical protein GCM10011289_19730 [Paludibacterium paludis]